VKRERKRERERERETEVQLEKRERGGRKKKKVFRLLSKSKLSSLLSSSQPLFSVFLSFSLTLFLSLSREGARREGIRASSKARRK